MFIQSAYSQFFYIIQLLEKYILSLHSHNHAWKSMHIEGNFIQKSKEYCKSELRKDQAFVYGTVEHFTPMTNTCPGGDSHHQLEGMFKTCPEASRRKVRPAMPCQSKRRPQPFLRAERTCRTWARKNGENAAGGFFEHSHQPSIQRLRSSPVSHSPPCRIRGKSSDDSRQ